MFNRILMSAFVFLTAAMSGCARLDYVKVPTPTQYSGWTDEDQQKADSMKGVRYYLPRPFLHLKKSIPVAQRVAFISFRFDPIERTYKLEPPQDPPTWLRRVAPQKISVGQALAATLARAGSEAAKQQAGGVDSDDPPSAEPGATEPPSTLMATTGFINQSDPVTELSDKMDIVYLPDFEEQYVIQAKTGMGKAKIETRLRNGWAAETFSVDVDNSQVVPYVIKQIEKVSDVAAGIATTWLPVAAGLPPGTSPAALMGAELQAGGVEGDLTTRVAENVLGQVLLFKIAEVRIAQPGVYPILKPREIQQWLKYDGAIGGGKDAQESFEKFLIQAKLPWIRPDVAFIPCPPFTMIGFNATTDVFLAPATDRGVMPSGDAESAARAMAGDLTRHINDIKAAIVKKKADLVADPNFINKQAIQVAVSKLGNGTVIDISAPPTPGNEFASASNAIKEQIINVFSPPGTLKLKENQVEVGISEDKKTATITILVNIPDLAQRARKVQ